VALRDARWGLFRFFRVHRPFDVDGVDRAMRLSAMLLQHREHGEMLEKFTGLWLEVSVKDTVVSLLG